MQPFGTMSKLFTLGTSYAVVMRFTKGCQSVQSVLRKLFHHIERLSFTVVMPYVQAAWSDCSGHAVPSAGLLSEAPALVLS